MIDVTVTRHRSCIEHDLDRDVFTRGDWQTCPACIMDPEELPAFVDLLADHIGARVRKPCRLRIAENTDTA